MPAHVSTEVSLHVLACNRKRVTSIPAIAKAMTAPSLLAAR
jgi:hypothetical protein